MEETHVLSLNQLKQWYATKFRGAKFPLHKRITLTTQFLTEMFKEDNWVYVKVMSSKATDTWTITIRRGVKNVRESNGIQ